MPALKSGSTLSQQLRIVFKTDVQYYKPVNSDLGRYHVRYLKKMEIFVLWQKNILTRCYHFNVFHWKFLAVTKWCSGGNRIRGSVQHSGAIKPNPKFVNPLLFSCAATYLAGHTLHYMGLLTLRCPETLFF
jgi:hypothetical protein